jgi:hypothetical protein
MSVYPAESALTIRYELTNMKKSKHQQNAMQLTMKWLNLSLPTSLAGDSKQPLTKNASYTISQWHFPL